MRRSLVTWSLVETGGVDDLTAGFYRDGLLRDARHKLRARSAAGSDATRVFLKTHYPFGKAKRKINLLLGFLRYRVS